MSQLRKRRTLKRIALWTAVGVVLLAVAASQYDGRIDSRLIGSWRVTGPPPVSMTETFTFKANGTTVEEQLIPVLPAPMKSARSSRFWTVDGDVLRFRSDDPKSMPIRMYRAYSSLRARMFGISAQVPAEDSWQIITVADATLRLKYTGGRRRPQPEYEFRRVRK